jgi:hypothetical protein
MTGEIDAATEGELIVNHHDFLMMRAANGVTIVKPDSHVAMRTPTQLPSRPRVPLERVERGVVPVQDVAAKLRPLSRDERQQFIESRRRIA